MSTKLLFIFNPTSGKANIKNHLFEIIDIFTKEDYDVTVHPTQCQDDAYNTIINKAQENDVVVVSGGDGTLNEAVRAMMTFDYESRKPIGYIPTGTTNDFAASRGISTDITEASRAIAKGDTFECDIGLFNQKHFTYVAAFGAFTDVSYDTPQEAKNIFGHAAYVWEGVKRLTKIESYHIKLTTKDETIEDDFSLGLILNSTHLAGFDLKRIESENIIDLTDGLFEIVLIKKPVTFLQIQEILNVIINGEIKETDQFVLIKTSNAHISCDREIKWTLDGEFGGAYKEVDMTVLNKPIKFIS